MCCLHKRQRALLAMTRDMCEGGRLEFLRDTRFLSAWKVSQSSYSKTSDGTRHGRLGNCCNISVGKRWTIPLQSEFGTQRHSCIFRLNGQLARTLFHLNEDVQCAAVVWVIQRSIRASGKDKLNVHWDKCLNRYGDCAET